MFPFDFLTGIVRPFRTTKPPIEDSDDEMDEPVSLTDTLFDADIPDSPGEDADMSMSTTAGVPASSFAAPPVIVDPDYTPSSPTSSYASSCDDLGALATQSSPPSDKNCVQRRVKSSMRHKAYSVPSRGQRETFKRYNRRQKDMFVENPLIPFVSNGPPTISPALDPLPTSGTSEPPTFARQAEHYLPALLEGKCSMKETRGQSAQAGSVSMPHARVAAKKSGLTIKIPGLVDRLALRLVHSCNVAEQAEEGDLDDSPDGYTASESSFEGDQDHIPHHSSPCSSPDRLSRRELRRRAVAPYYRTRKPKRKELWLNSEVVPAVLLSSERHTRSLRSGRRF